MLFYSTEKLILEMGFGRPALDPSIFVGKLPDAFILGQTGTWLWQGGEQQGIWDKHTMHLRIIKSNQ